MKKFLSILLALVMVFAMIPMTTGVAYAQTEPVCKVLNDNPSLVVRYNSIESAITAIGTKEATIKLLSDVNCNITIPANSNITIDLNGFVISAKELGSVITNYGTLRICDSKPYATHVGSSIVGGVITGGMALQGGGIFNESNATLVMDGGTIYYCWAATQGGSEDGNGGGVFNEGTFTMNAGTIDYCISACGGGGVYNEYYTSKFVFNGGTIQNCGSYTNGGGIYNEGKLTVAGGVVYNCKAQYYGCGVYNVSIFNMTDGAIKNCSPINFNEECRWGSGVYNCPNGLMGEEEHKTTFNMSGGIISGCEAMFGGAIFNEPLCTINLSGTARIENNKARDAGAGIFNQAGGILNMSGSAIITENESCGLGAGIYTEGNSTLKIGGNAQVVRNLQKFDDTIRNANIYLSTNSSISVDNPNKMLVGVTLQNTEAEIASSSFKDYSPYFVSDDLSYMVKKETYALKLGSYSHIHSFTYKDNGVDSSIPTNTIVAVCGGSGDKCQYTYTVLTISAPEYSKYGDQKDAKAILSTTEIGGIGVSSSEISYEGILDTEYTNSNVAPTAVGTYRASITISSKVAYVDYTISKRSVTFASDSDSKIYDGTPLTNASVAVLGDGFASGEGATYVVSGSQTDLGSTLNSFEYTLEEGTNPNNYIFDKNVGTLIVASEYVEYPEVWEPYYETLALKIAAQAEIEAAKMLEEAKVNEESVIEEPKAIELVASSEETIAPNDKNSVKVTWVDKNGQDLTFEGYDVYRASNNSDEYKFMFNTTNEWYYNTLIRAGQKYSYKVKGYNTVDGEKVYSEFSTVTSCVVK